MNSYVVQVQWLKDLSGDGDIFTWHDVEECDTYDAAFSIYDGPLMKYGVKVGMLQRRIIEVDFQTKEVRTHGAMRF